MMRGGLLYGPCMPRLGSLHAVLPCVNATLHGAPGAMQLRAKLAQLMPTIMDLAI